LDTPSPETIFPGACSGLSKYICQYIHIHRVHPGSAAIDCKEALGGRPYQDGVLNSTNKEARWRQLSIVKNGDFLVSTRQMLFSSSSVHNVEYSKRILLPAFPCASTWRCTGIPGGSSETWHGRSETSGGLECTEQCTVRPQGARIVASVEFTLWISKTSGSQPSKVGLTGVAVGMIM
jgi:hypothetical protein